MGQLSQQGGSMTANEQAQDAQFISLMQRELGGEIGRQLKQQDEQRRKDFSYGMELISWDEFAGNYS